MAYADYTYYTDTYKGFKTPSASFEYYSERASEVLDNNVNVEIDATILTTYETQIKKCVCALTDILYSDENDKQKKITSEKTLTYSVTYDSSTTKSLEQSISKVLALYLTDTTLIFRGLY